MLYGIVVTGMSRETFLCSIDAVNAFFSWDKVTHSLALQLECSVFLFAGNCTFFRFLQHL